MIIFVAHTILLVTQSLDVLRLGQEFTEFEFYLKMVSPSQFSLMMSRMPIQQLKWGNPMETCGISPTANSKCLIHPNFSYT